MGDQDGKERRIYAQRSTITLGMGETSRSVASESFYEAFSLPDGRIKMVLLDMNDQLTGIAEILDSEEVEENYKFVPGYLDRPKKTDQERFVEKKLAEGRGHLERQEYHSAEYEFDKVIRVDERQVEAHLGKGQSRLGQGDTEGAREVFEQVAEFDEL
jgi:hypothetical protein